MHRLALISSLSLVLGTACPPTVPGYTGYAMPDFFAFDGACRSWEFVSTDTSLPYKMVGILQADVSQAADGFTSIYTIDYVTQCVSADETCVDDELLRSMTISSSTAGGTLIYEFDPDGSSPMSFDPPLKMTEGTMEPLENSVGESGGVTLTTDFVQVTSCDIRWADWNGCAELDVDDAGGGTGLSGTWTVAPGWNVVAMELDDEGHRWSLDRGVFTSSESDCADEGLPVVQPPSSGG